MLLIFLTTILDSISDVLYKKTLAMADVKPMVFQSFGELFGLPILIGIACWDFNLGLFINVKVMGLLVGVTSLYMIHNSMGQYLYKQEKLSTLLPYAKINNLIAIIIGFVFFRDSSLVSFLICLGAILLATLASIDFHERALPKNFPVIIMNQLVKTAELMLTVYTLKIISSVEYIVVGQSIYFTGAILFICLSGQMSEFKKFTPRMIRYRGSGYLIGMASYFIDVFLLKEFGIVITTLFGFFGSSLALTLAYFFMDEVPERKEIILGIVMIALAGVGYYLR